MTNDDTKLNPPIISTPWGPVTEAARLQAAINLREDPARLAKVIEMIGEAETRRRYPEVWE